MDVAALGLSVDSDGVVRGVDALERFTKASGTAEKAADSLSGASKRSGDGTRQMAQAAQLAESSTVRFAKGIADTVERTERYAGAAIKASSATWEQEMALKAAAMAQQHAENRAWNLAKAEEALANNSRRASVALAENALAANKVASASRAANDNIAGMAGPTKAATFAARNLNYQLMDMAQGFALGMPPMMILMQQVPQAADAFSMLAKESGGAGSAIAGLASKFGPAALAVGAVSGGVLLLTEEINKNSEVTVTWQDVVFGAFDGIANAIKSVLLPAWGAVAPYVSAVWDFVVKATRAAYNIIAASIVALPRLIMDTYDKIPAAFGDAFYSAANLAIKAVNWLVEKAAAGVNKLVSVFNAVFGTDIKDVVVGSLGEIANPYAGGMAALGKAGAASLLKSFSTDYHQGALDTFKGWAVDHAIKRGAEEAGKKVGRSAGKAAGKSMADEMAKELQYRIPAILKEVEKWGNTPLKIEGIDIAKWFEEQERRRQEEAQRHRDLAMRTAYDIADIIGGGVGRAVAELADALDRFEGVLPAIGKALGGLDLNTGKLAGMAGIGSIFGGSGAGSLGGIAGGIAGEAAKKAFGSLSAFAGPLGAIAGGLIGGLIGGMFKKTPKAMATVSIIGGEAMETAISGNKSRLRAIAGGMADSLLNTLDQLADALDAALGDASVSIGMRKKKYVVDPTGAGRTKGAGVFKFESEAEALKFAVQDAIRDGALAGLAAGFQAYLSSGDVEKRLQDVLSLQGALNELKSIKDPTGYALEQLEKSFDALRVIANATGVGLVELEELYGIKRAEALAKAAQEALEKARPYREAEIQIMELEGRTREAQLATRALELEAMEEGLRPLYQRIHALQDEAEAAAKAQAIADEALSIQTQIDQLLGNTVAIRERERAAINEANLALYDHYIALQDEAEAAAALKAVADERLGLEKQWLQTIGDTIAIRAMELAALDETNRALQQQIWAEQDRIAALDEAAKAAEAVAAAEKAIADERMGLMRQIWQLTGNTAALRADTLAQLDESNRPLQEYIWALEEAAKAEEALTAAMQARQANIDAARNTLIDAYNRESSALQSTIDKFRDFSTSIRAFRDGLLGQGNPAFGLAQAQATFASTSRMAGLGSEKALGAFAGDAQAYLNAARMGEYEQYQRAMAQVLAGSNSAIKGADGMVSTAQKQLNALEKSVAGILDLREDVVTVAEALADYNAAVNAQIPAMAETVSASIDTLSEKFEASAGEAKKAREEAQIALETSAIAMNRIERLLSRMETDNGLAVTLSGEVIAVRIDESGNLVRVSGTVPVSGSVNANITNTPLPVDQVP